MLLLLRRSRFPLCLAAALAATAPGFAQSVPTDSFDAKIGRYDKAAVDAALSYLKAFNIRASFDAMAPALRQQVAAAARSNNPGLSDADANAFADEFIRQALIVNAPLIEKMTLAMMLESFAPDEIIAMNGFYTSPIGKRILAKTPAYMAKLPNLMLQFQQAVVPSALRAAQEKLKSQGKDIKI